MRDDASEVKSRVDIVELIGSYVQLRQAGSSFVGLCPFHAEKTPSFHVSRDRQTFHCFGCGKGGDVYVFVMEMEGLGFREALELLADRAGVKLSPWGGGRPKPEPSGKGAREAMAEASDFFRKSLAGPGGEAARSYLARRNITGEDISRFGLGWAPQSWNALSGHLESCGFPPDEIYAAGLTARGERGAYDRFRGRIIFPVNDENGRIAAFGGRLIDGEGAKYINSPEGPIFNKRRTLYLMDMAKRSVRERGRAILMEGYMDAIRAHIAGFTETVASLGTSLTEEQAELIKRFSDLCYISYDADGAGQAASIRGMYILQRHGVDVRVVMLPEGRDPDDVMSSGGAGAFEPLLERAVPLPLYHALIKRRDFHEPGRAQGARDEVFGGLASLPALDVEVHLPGIARVFGVLEHDLRREINARRSNAPSGALKNKKNGGEGISDHSDVYIYNRARGRAADLECAFCSLLWRGRELRSDWKCEELIAYFADETALSIVSALLSGSSPEELETMWQQTGESRPLECIARGDAVLESGNLGVRHAEALLEDIRRNAAQRRVDELQPMVIRGEASSGDTAEYHDLVKKLKAPRDHRFFGGKER
ncbi:MAG: DNA primase [Synergistaceae bacterium]|jgi:DNA primase|nr:DNA primase [Synergistaceae bacterium]